MVEQEEVKEAFEVTRDHEDRWRGWARLLGAGFLAMIIFALVDGGLFRATRSLAPPIALAADLRLSSLLLLSLLVALSPARRLLRLAVMPDGRVMVWGVGWLFGCYLLVHFTGVGRIPLPRWQDAFAFHLTGVLAEELLIRGLVLTAAWRLWPPAGRRPGPAVLVSAAVFAMMHHQYHGYRFDAAAWSQAAWTFPAGVLWGWITERTRSLWPSVFIHLVNNGLVALA